LTLNARHRWDVIARVVEERHPTSILELGAGLAATGARLAQRAHYVGIEPDPTSREAAGASLSRCARSAELYADLSQIDAERCFDLVCAFEVLEHVDDDVAALSQWSTRLADGGIVLISVPAHRSRFGPADARVGHLRRYDRVDVEALVSGAGLRLERLWSTGWPMGLLLERAWNAAARSRPASGSAATRSSASGRWFQPARAIDPLWTLVSAPSVAAQRTRYDSDSGTGWVAMCTCD
jgi:SAM-dependent methyltransferase